MTNAAMNQEENMIDRQLYLFGDLRLEAEMSGVDGDGLGPGEEIYEGELEALWVEQQVAVG